MESAVDQVKRRKVYTASATASDIIADVSSLREMDKQAEQELRTGMILVVAGLTIAVLSGIFLVTTMDTRDAGALPMLGIGLGALLLIGGFVYRSIVGGANLDDRRYELLVASLDMLRRDMAETSTVDVHLDFRSPTDRSKYTHKGSIGYWNVSFYRDPWLSLQGRLMDGTSFLLNVDELTQKRGRWKRSRSGKNKYKSKTKTATVAALQLKPKPHKYPQLDTLAEAATSHIQIPDWCELKKSSVSANGIAMKVGAKVDWGVVTENFKTTYNGAQMVAMMFLSLYRTLNQSRQLRKSGGDQA